MTIYRWTTKKFLLTVFVIHVFFLLYLLHWLHRKSQVPVEDYNYRHPSGKVVQQSVQVPRPRGVQKHFVEVWGKAAIGIYFWEHVFNATLVTKLRGVWSFGRKKINDVTYRFRTGPGVDESKVPQDVVNLVLILNGMDENKLDYSKQWLNFAHRLKYLKNLGLVLLGNEQCNNSWLDPYMKRNGGRVKFVFVVYDIPERDDEVYYQWPLGVATYRGFPRINVTTELIETPRWYKCNFLGTIYPNSTRVTMAAMVKSYSAQSVCHMKTRDQWQPQESDVTRTQYLTVLTQSDLTLCPVGKNAESYRIWEALSAGSVPVVEDVFSRGRCGRRGGDLAPHRLLKQHGAPVQLLQRWEELPGLLRREARLSERRVERRRADVLRWYRDFKVKMKVKFHQALRKHFFGQF